MQPVHDEFMNRPCCDCGCEDCPSCAPIVAVPPMRAARVPSGLSFADEGRLNMLAITREQAIGLAMSEGLSFAEALQVA